MHTQFGSNVCTGSVLPPLLVQNKKPQVLVTVKP